MRFRRNSQRVFGVEQLDPRLRPGLVAWWGRVSGAGIVDVIGGRHARATTGSPRESVGPLVSGDGLRFTRSSSDFLSCGQSAQLALQGEFSVSLWLRLAGNYTDAQGLVSCAGSAGDVNAINFFVEFGFTDNRLSLWHSGAGPMATSSRAISDDLWHHYAVVRSGSSGAWSVRIYIDGVLDSTTASATNPTGTSPDWVGLGGAGYDHFVSGHIGYPGYHLEGTLSDVKLYARAISGAEAAQLAWPHPVVRSSGRRRLHLPPPPPLVVTPDPSDVVLDTVAPTVTLGAITITPAPSDVVLDTVAPSVVYGSVTITPAPSDVVLDTAAPIVGLGSAPGWLAVGTGVAVPAPGGASLYLPGAGFIGLVRADVETLVAGAAYRLSGRCRLVTGDRDDASLTVRADVGSGALLQLDGRHAGTAPIPLALNTEERAFQFDFLAPTSSMRLEVRLTAGAAAEVHLAAVRLQRVHRWESYEPRLPAGGVPTLEDGEVDPFFSGARVGSGTLRIVNADGLLSPALAGLDWLGHEVALLLGGGFQDGGELTIEEAEPVTLAVVQRASADDRHLQLELEDSRATVHRDIPERNYSVFEAPALDIRAEGKKRPLLIGTKTNITPTRIDLLAGYGVYEIADCSVAPNGIKAIDVVRAYADDQARSAADNARSVELAAGVDYAIDLAQGAFTVLLDVGPYEVVAGESDRLDFTIGAGAVSASLTPGLYTAAALAAHVAAALTAAAATTIVATYSESTHLVTVSKASGTLELLLGSGANKDRSGWKLLGFSGSSNLTGALSYLADTVLFTGPDQHRLAVDAQGYADDGAGTYTGTPGALITLGPDVARFVWRRLMGRPLELVDSASFVAARAACPQQLGIYLGAATSTRVLLDRIETSVLADISIDGAGRVFFQAYGSSGDPVGALTDRDFLASTPYTEARGTADIYSRVAVLYDQDPTTGSTRSRSATANVVEARHGRPQGREFPTWLTSSDDAQRLANQLLVLAGSGPVVASGAVKGALLRARPGQLVTITRARAPFASDGRAAHPFRLLSLRRDPVSGVVQFEAVETVEV